jgi:hypothetical protein
VFISYDEPNADDNFKRLLEFAPNAKRVHGIDGIHKAHKAAANLATTDMVYIVDGDAYILDDWKFDFKPGIFDRDKIYIWHSKNPVNDLEYGYGGVKLFPRKKLVSADENLIDMTTSLGDVNVINKPSNITAFNTDPFSAWRSGVRECVKLVSGVIKGGKLDDEDKTRIVSWKTLGQGRPYGEFCMSGADFGIKHGIKSQQDRSELPKINDRDWLKAQFKEEFPDADI